MVKMTLILRVQKMVEVIDPKNAEFILNDNRFKSDVELMQRFEKKGNQRMVEAVFKDLEKRAKEFDRMNLTPANVEIGGGVSIKLWSDAHAATIIKKTKTSITVQRDKSNLDPNWKPEVIAGGFAGHCTNQGSQTYTYEQDPNGQTYTFRWSKKYSCFRDGQSGLKLYKGRREFYDYNF